MKSRSQSSNQGHEWYSSTERVSTDSTRWHRTTSGHLRATVQVAGFDPENTQVQIVTGTLNRTMRITHHTGDETTEIRVPLPAQVAEPVGSASMRNGLLTMHFTEAPKRETIEVPVGTANAQ